jgi:23S rRNA pseudouridine1911/1915/1917 synthase
MARLFGLSRTTAAAIVDSGDALLDGVASSKATRVRAGQLLEVRLPEPRRLAEPAPAVRLPILYADDDVVVVDKPVAVAVHASPGWTGPTVVDGIAAQGLRVSTSGAAERQGVVHRLDAGTSGVLVVAASERAYTALKRSFKNRTVDKRYSALVQGHPDPSRGTVDAPIGRHPGADYKFAVVAGGRPSVTHYDTVEAFPAASLLDIDLETGRTHQIRVHMAAIRHPCVGDLTYGADPVLAARLGLQRQWLHARELTFTHPGSGERVTFVSPLPPDLQHALDLLR